jgi:hypothetical protein
MGTRLRGHQYAKESKEKWVGQLPVARTSMQKPPLDPDVSDTAPSAGVDQHLITYLRLLDAVSRVFCAFLVYMPPPIRNGH